MKTFRETEIRFSMTLKETFVDHTDTGLIDYVGMEIASNTSRYRKLVGTYQGYPYWSQKCYGK